VAELGIYPAVDPLDSTSRQVDPNVIGEEHYRTTRDVQATLQRYKELQDIIAILAWTNCPRTTGASSAGHARSSVSCRSRSSSPKCFTGTPGKYVSLKETIRGFRGIVDGEYDHIPEQAFYMVGTIDEVVEKAKTL